ncbi:MAG: hypothetical protein AAFQ89_18165 [Cyanobacteria bacterium J06626_18]
MALLPFFRFVVKQLKRLTRPVPLISGVTIGILAIFVSEYLTHPEWFGTYSQEGEEPSQSLDLLGLTPEEQAAVADIDNLSVLFNDLGIAAPGGQTLQVLPQEDGLSEDGLPQDGLLQDLAVLTEPVDVGPLSEGPSPFEQYLNQYQFGQPSQGLALPTPNATAPASGSNSGVPSSSSLSVPGLPFQGNATLPSGQLETSALERAINAQGASTSLPGDDADVSSLGNEERSLEGGETSDLASTGTESALTSESSNPQTATIPGVPFPFLPTSPEMSPPPGTTGYTPPASLQSVQQPTDSGSPSSFPSSGTALPSPGSAGVPNIPSAGSVPNLATPQVDVSNGATTPSLPSSIVPSATDGIAPPPTSSVPRPPGSYTGNGYINTFSNPSGPPQ